MPRAECVPPQAREPVVNVPPLSEHLERRRFATGVAIGGTVDFAALAGIVTGDTSAVTWWEKRQNEELACVDSAQK